MEFQRSIASASLLLALAVGGALRWTPAEAVADLRPRPDALEYEEAARSLLAGRGYTLPIAGELQPPRYPAGMSLAIAPVLWASGGQPGSGRLVVWLAALATLAGVWRLVRPVAGTIGALVAALVVASSPAHVSWSKAVMSDVPAAAVVTWLACMAVGGEAARSPWRAALFGVAVGASSLVRLSLPLIALPLVLVRCRHGRDGAACVAGIVLGLVPVLAMNAVSFGAPWRTGYDYWVRWPSFDVHAAFAPPFGATQGNVPAYLRLLAGRGSLYSPAVALCALLGAVVAWRAGSARRRTAVAALGVILATLGVYAAYFWQSERFVLPIVPMAATLAGLAVGDGVGWLVRGPLLVALGAGVAITVATPGVFDPPDRNLHEVETLTALQQATPPDAVILARTSVLLAERYLRADGADRIWVSIDADQHLQVLHLRGEDPESRPGGRWIEPAVASVGDMDRTAAMLARHLAAGRRAFIVAQPNSHLPFMGALDQTLHTRFALRPAGTAGPYRLLEIAPR